MNALVDLPRKIGCSGFFRAIDGSARRFRVVDEIVREQPVREKATRMSIHLQKLQFDDTNCVEYRFTYYMLGVRGPSLGRWVFGQFSLLIPPDDLQFFLKAARERGWEGFA